MDDGYFDAYDRARQRISAVVSAHRHDLGNAVPACPGWTAKAVVAHLVGLAADVVSGNTEHYSEPAWTAAHVAARETVALPELLAEWEEIIPRLRAAPLPAIGRSLGSLGSLVFADASVHEHDLRGALGEPDPENESAQLGLVWSVDLLRRVLRRAQEAGRLPALALSTTSGESWILGSSEDVVTLSADAFELWRGLTGRRASPQLVGLSWNGDPKPLLQYWPLPPLQLPADPLGY